VTDAESPSQSPKTLYLSLALLLLAAGLLFFSALGRSPLIEPDEGRNAEVGREMMVTGDWISPHFNGFVVLDKPAVFFWMVAASLKTFGVSEWAARFPSALMGVATMLLVWFLAGRMFGGSTGLRAGLIFVTSPLALVLAREVIFDMTLTFLVTLAMVAFWLAEENQYRVPWFELLMFAAMGLAVITKGFVGILIPLISILIYQAVRGRWREWLRLRWGWGLLVLLAVALPWFIAVSMRNPDFPRYAFWNESLKRFATGAARRGGGIFYYIPVFVGGFFPWSLFVLIAGWNRLRRWRELRQELGRPILFLLCWAAWVFVFFTLSHSKLPTYFLPAIVPLSILAAQVWQDVGEEGQTRAPDWLTAGFALLLGLGVIAAAASHSWLYTWLAKRLHGKVQPDVSGFIQPCLLYTGLILAALGFLGRRLAIEMRGRTAAAATFALAAAIFPVLALRWYTPWRLFAEGHSSRRLAETILASPLRDSPIVGYYYFRNSLPFYLHRPEDLLSIHWGEMTSNYQVAHQAALRRAGDERVGKGVLLTLPEFWALAKANTQPVLVISPNSLVENLYENAKRIEPLWNGADFSVWEIPPVNASNAETPCIQAEKEASSLPNWPEVYKSYKTFAQCDDAAIGEGYSDSVARLLADAWDSADELNRLVSRDGAFESFVLRHIDELMSSSQAKRILENAAARCPAHAEPLCTAIVARTREVFVETHRQPPVSREKR
jgi:4-amino-4-deoxy-L-arabinose transferase-like glycosyltransferase